MTTDLLCDCAKAYVDLMNYHYKFKASLNNKQKDFTLSFNSEDFKHLSGIEKLIDLPQYSEMDSDDLFDEILNGNITTEDLSKSEFYNKPLNEFSPKSNGTLYYLEDRIKELTHLFNYLHNISLKNIEVFKWPRDVVPYKRPNNSKINADILIVISNGVHKKTNSETLCTFFIDTSNAKCSPVSLFPTDISYSNDGRISLPKYDVMSISEILKSTNEITAHTEISVIDMQKANENIQKKAINTTIVNDIKSLKSKRNKVIENPSVGNQNKYDKQLTIFKNRNIYTADMVKEVINRLNDQLSAAPNDKVADMIKSEIKYLQDDLIDRQQNPPQQLKGISISTVQMNDDSTLSVNNIATLPVPKAVTEVPKLVQRKTHTLTGTIKSFLSDVSDSIRKALTPKSHSEARRASQSKNKGNSPKKKQVAKKAVSVAPAKRSEKQEQRSSVLGDITSARKELEKQRREAPTKEKHNNIEI